MKSNRFRNVIIALVLSLSMVASCGIGAFAKSAAEYDSEADDAASKANAANSKFYDAELKALAAQDEIDAKTSEIAESKEKMEEKQEEVKVQEGSLNDRLTAMYKTGTVGYIDVILSSEGITDLIQNLGMVQQILKSDQALLKQLESDYKEIETLKKQQEEAKVVLEQKQAEIEKIKAEYKAEAEKYQAQEENLRALSDQAAAAAAAEAAAAEEAAGGGGSSSSGGGGSFTPSGQYAWPTRSNYKITSPYGWRWHPIWGDQRFHDGLDIVLTSGTYGSPVYAVGDGVVTYAGWYGGYGNYVRIAIGNGYVPFYGHMASIAVSSGQSVSKGQVIGYIGSTGDSTGAHLHFGLYQYGSSVNPYNLY